MKTKTKMKIVCTLDEQDVNRCVQALIQTGLDENVQLAHQMVGALQLAAKEAQRFADRLSLAATPPVQAPPGWSSKG